MKKPNAKQNGIALIVAILLSFMMLTLIGALLWLVVSGTKMSGMYRYYASAHDAAVGGAEVMMDILYWRHDPNLPLGTYNISDCFSTKRDNPMQLWGKCLDSSPDITMYFGKKNSSDSYTVNATITSKIIEDPDPASNNNIQKTYYAISIDASNSTRLDKSSIDFVYLISQPW